MRESLLVRVRHPFCFAHYWRPFNKLLTLSSYKDARKRDIFSTKTVTVPLAVLLYLMFLDWWSMDYILHYVGFSPVPSSSRPYELDPLMRSMLTQPNAAVNLQILMGIAIIATLLAVVGGYRLLPSPRFWTRFLLLCDGVCLFGMSGGMYAAVSSFLMFGVPGSLPTVTFLCGTFVLVIVVAVCILSGSATLSLLGTKRTP